MAASAGVSNIGPIETRREDDVWVLTIRVPKKRNALNAEAENALAESLRIAMASDECRAIVVTGADGVFCAGGDISDMHEGPVEAQRRLERASEIAVLLAKGPKPVIAAVDGYASGAGLSIAASCDHVVASKGAAFCAAFARVGLIADVGLLHSLPQRVGMGFAKRMLILGELFSAETCQQHGLVDTLVEDDHALDAALDIARTFARQSPLATKYTKAILAMPPTSVEGLLAVESYAQAVLFTSSDFEEGRKAFFEKRAPTFTGN